MRGPFDDQGQLFSYISPEQRVPTQHPLRTIRELGREVFRDLDHDFRIRYSTVVRRAFLRRWHADRGVGRPQKLQAEERYRRQRGEFPRHDTQEQPA
jgi:hypothetical protein